MSRVLTFIPSVIFTIIFINTSYIKLGLKTTQILLLKLFINSFSIPLISSIFLNGNYYLGKNLYFTNTMSLSENMNSSGYMSNHLAWSGIIVFASSLAYIEMAQLTKSKKIMLYFLMLFSVMTIINSGSRTILVTLIFYLFAFFIKNFSFRLNFIKSLIFTFLIIFSLTKIDLSKIDSINFMIYRTNVHLANQKILPDLLILIVV